MIFSHERFSLMGSLYNLHPKVGPTCFKYYHHHEVSPGRDVDHVEEVADGVAAGRPPDGADLGELGADPRHGVHTLHQHHAITRVLRL